MNKITMAVADSGAADIINAAGGEFALLLIPFSDPIAESPEIQAASTAALENGMTVDKGLAMIGECNVPIVVAVYSNTLFNYGEEKFFETAKKCGAVAVYIADAPAEQNGAAYAAATKTGLPLITAIAPAAGEQRMIDLAKNAQFAIFVMSPFDLVYTPEKVQTLTAKAVQKLRTVTDLKIYAFARPYIDNDLFDGII